MSNLINQNIFSNDLSSINYDSRKHRNIFKNEQINRFQYVENKKGQDNENKDKNLNETKILTTNLENLKNDNENFNLNLNNNQNQINQKKKLSV